MTRHMKDFNTIVTEQLKIPAADISDSLTPKDVPEWDSMNYLLFIAEIEKEYKVSFTMDEVLGMESVGQIKDSLRAKGVDV